MTLIQTAVLYQVLNKLVPVPVPVLSKQVEVQVPVPEKYRSSTSTSTQYNKTDKLYSCWYALHRVLYWTDVSATGPAIYRSSVVNPSLETLISDNIHWPNALAVDFAGNQKPFTGCVKWITFKTAVNTKLWPSVYTGKYTSRVFRAAVDSDPIEIFAIVSGAGKPVAKWRVYYNNDNDVYSTLATSKQSNG